MKLLTVDIVVLFMQNRYLWLVTGMLGLNNVFDAILIAQKPWCSLQPAPCRTVPHRISDVSGVMINSLQGKSAECEYGLVRGLRRRL